MGFEEEQITDRLNYALLIADDCNDLFVYKTKRRSRRDSLNHRVINAFSDHRLRPNQINYPMSKSLTSLRRTLAAAEKTMTEEMEEEAGCDCVLRCETQRGDVNKLN